jgi:hypothetical protein
MLRTIRRRIVLRARPEHRIGANDAHNRDGRDDRQYDQRATHHERPLLATSAFPRGASPIGSTARRARLVSREPRRLNDRPGAFLPTAPVS